MSICAETLLLNRERVIAAAAKVPKGQEDLTVIVLADLACASGVAMARALAPDVAWDLSTPTVIVARGPRRLLQEALDRREPHAAAGLRKAPSIAVCVIAGDLFQVFSVMEDTGYAGFN
ncbi:hypothetical protein LZC95_08235 [Pendulispora brunnea]|uniref:Uncharacterized protein n=1 Tax=Pendulispora brunnea TaxID=2905690 RepID=A0ABZ2KE03_9BACT